MSDMALTVREFQDALNGEGYLKGRIVSVAGISTFRKKWSEYDFKHEEPFVVLEIDTSIESFQILISLSRITEDPLHNLFADQTDITELLDKEVRVVPTEDFSKVGISKLDYSGDVDTNSRVRIEDPHTVRFSGKHVGRLHSYPTEISRLNQLVKSTLNRDHNPHNWLSVDLRADELDDKTVIHAERDDMDLDANWSFDGGFIGVDNLADFMDDLSANHALESEEASAWIKPLWDLDTCELADDRFISDNDYWIICSNPTELRDTPIRERISNLIRTKGKERLYHVHDTHQKGKEATSCESENWFDSIEN